VALPIRDVRFSTRRVDGQTLLYPRLMRDRAILPKIQIAIRYFESMLGKERREFDAETLVHFFGDHKLTRCMVAALARSYRFRSPGLHEIVSRVALRRLSRLGIGSPKALRLRLYDRANAGCCGFLGASARDQTFAEMEADLRLRVGELDRLLTLDAEEHALLVRVGAEPRPLDVVAQYNFAVLETMVRHASAIELAVAGWDAAERARVEALLRAHGVEARVGARELGLRGRPDAMGLWSRHGRRVAGALVRLLEHERAGVLAGTARLKLRERALTLALTPELLDVLGGAPAPATGWEARSGWSAVDLAAALRGPRTAEPGTLVRRSPEPQAWALGTVAPELLVQVEGDRALVCAVRSSAHAQRLAPIAEVATSGEPIVFVGDPGALAPLVAIDAAVGPMERFSVEGAIEAVRAALTLAGRGSGAAA
jgi:Protein of unknown function (DUF790)